MVEAAKVLASSHPNRCDEGRNSPRPPISHRASLLRFSPCPTEYDIDAYLLMITEISS
jgi:hypothetical protein